MIKKRFSVDVGAVPIRETNNIEYVEIDFIVNKLDTKIYIQSAYQMLDDDKVKQEVRPFTLTNDFFKKVIIRNDIINSFYDEQGVYHCRLIDFLLDKVFFKIIKIIKIIILKIDNFGYHQGNIFLI